MSGHMASIQNLKRAFNEGLDAEKLIEKEPDVNTIAALLKLYFRELREPLMLFDFYPSFIAAAGKLSLFFSLLLMFLCDFTLVVCS